MAIPFDVGARLAEGRPVVDDVAEYVAACRRLGYQHPDLTMHPTQVRDWYDGEVGLDLRALDADCAALAGLAAAAEGAARTHTDLAAELSGAWSGRGADQAREFVWRSGQAAISVSSAVRGAADALAALRDALWQAVDVKVATVQDIDGRHRAQRAEWLAAARTVTTGVGDVAAASELVDQQVKPFVQADIGSDWVAAMRAATASIGAAYDAAVASTSVGAPAVFDVPGELGPRAASAGIDRGAADPLATTPPIQAMTGIPSAASAFTPGAAQVPAAALPAIDPAAGAPLTAPAAAVPAPSMPSTPSLGDLGGAAPGLGSGVSGFGQQLADLIGGLVGSFGGADDPALDDPGLDDPAAEDPAFEDPADDTNEESSPDDPAAGDAPGEPAGDASGEVTEEVPTDAAPPPTAVPPPPAPIPPPAVPEGVAQTAESTACEIAADELPQVGE